MTVIFGTGVSTVAAEGSFGVKLKGFGLVVCVAYVTTTATKGGLLAVGVFCAFLTGVEILADVAHFVGTWSQFCGLAGLSRCGTTLCARHVSSFECLGRDG